ncbi:Ribonuclease H domain [Sesbania bispinosa]|nr:Ribonuclease H domain [Sesbania bispinosa]
MTSNNLCPKCNFALETIMYLLRDCDIVAELWESLIDSNSWASFFSLGQDQWIRKNLELSNHSVAGVNWSFIFPICIWSLWKDRNSLVFKQKTDLPGNLFFHVISYARRTIEVIAGPSPLSQRIFKKEEFVGWSKPPNNFYKLNVDASVILPSLNASCGGLIRDHDGSFIKGFSCNIGLSSTVKAELWGLLHGLNLAASLKISNLIVNVDSLLAVQMVKGSCKSTHHCMAIVRSIRKILSEHKSFILSHVFRESNRSADHLASIGHNQQLGINVYNSVPRSLGPFLLEDIRGVCFPRIVPSR